MKELTLHPLSVLLAWRFPEPRPREVVEGLVAAWCDTLAQAVAREPGAVIGHIKGLAKLGGQEWLKVSVIAPDRPAQVESRGQAPLAALDLAVNLMVYGREPAELFSLVQAVTAQEDRPWRGLVEPALPARGPARPLQTAKAAPAV
ncbi:MAG: hypothetical protein KQJ78_24780 [Deltaproteobacteria bacterium]|nr:hypothetical protein [Deltaproteobacteria bacterium]